MREGLLRYNQAKSRAWFRSRGLQLPKEGSIRGNKKICAEADVVNRGVTPDWVTVSLSGIRKLGEVSKRGAASHSEVGRPTPLRDTSHVIQDICIVDLDSVFLTGGQERGAGAGSRSF